MGQRAGTRVDVEVDRRSNVVPFFLQVLELHGQRRQQNHHPERFRQSKLPDPPLVVFLSKQVVLSRDHLQAVVHEMNRIGMMIDLSRSATKTQLAVLEETKAPVIFTATAAHNITPVEGNIEDEVLGRVVK